MYLPSALARLTIILSVPCLVTAHGKVTSATGDLGGNTTALGILGATVPGTGPNDITEVDTTIFKKKNILSNGLGKTTGGGKNRPEDLLLAMFQSGSALPQVNNGGEGRVRGVFHVVTTDGAGPVRAVIDATAKGHFRNGTEATVLTDVPGNDGNINADGTVPKKLKVRRGLMRRSAQNVNMDFPFEIRVPANVTCEGVVMGIEAVCFMKIANSNSAGPFGGVIAFQMADAPSVNGTGVGMTFRM